MNNSESKMMSQEQVLDWLAEVFNESRDNITAESKRDDIASWDSLGVLTLMADLDEKFDLVLSDENIPGLKGSQTINEMDSFINRDPTLSTCDLFSEPVPVVIMSGTEKCISQKVFTDKIHAYKNFKVVDVLTKRNLLPYLFANFLKQKTG